MFRSRFGYDGLGLIWEDDNWKEGGKGYGLILGVMGSYLG